MLRGQTACLAGESAEKSVGKLCNKLIAAWKTGKEDGIYSAEFTVPKSGRVVLERSMTDVVEVYVNGTCAGKRLWNPYRFDLAETLQ